jgi:hypothetical protein
MAYDEEAWSKYRIVEISDEYVEVHFSTNDDYDAGYPTKYANEIFVYDGENALEHAKSACGVSRQGVGHRVYVSVNGEEV